MPHLALIVLLPLLFGTTLCFLTGRQNTRARRAATAWVAAIVTGLALALLTASAPAVFGGQTLLEQHDWIPSLGLNLGFRLDGLALMFGWMITGIGLLIILYAAWYLHHDDPAGKFYTLLMVFMAAMLGIVLSDNLLLLVVFWELTSVSSFLLVGYWGQLPGARAGARMALTVTGGGGLAMLAGVIVLGQIAGTYELSEMLTRGAEIRADGRFDIALILILLGCFTKSAQFPFHFWLPEAMAAPTPVSAYLHSATMVKAGLFMMMRLYPIVGGSELFEVLVAGFGLFTMVFAAFVALFKHDLKGLLAYSTVSHLGLITFLIGLSSPLASVAAVFHVLNHATFKASLFMTAGIIDHETGTRDMRKLGGLMKLMPWTATLAMVAAASMAGVPLVNGFLSKEMFFAEAVDASNEIAWGALMPVLATIGGIFSVAYSLRFIHDVFFHHPGENMPNPHPHDPPFFMRLPVKLLVVLCIAVGLFPAITYGPLVAVAAAAVLGAPPPEYHLALWHGFNVPLVMSIIALAFGVAVYFGMQRGGRLHSYLPKAVNAKAIFTGVIDGLFGAAGRITALLENGSMQRHVAWMLAFALVLGIYPFLLGGALPVQGDRPLTPASPIAIVAWLLMVTVGVALVRGHHERFRAVVLVGVIGAVSALAFIGMSAPDLALTQISVEIVSTALLLMGLALLPQTTPRESSAARKGRDAVLAIGCGAGISVITWLVLTTNFDAISWYFLENSLPGGGGTNIVNVILVDFRGYDTFGEITVLGIAGVGVMALLDGLRVRSSGCRPARPSLEFRPSAADAAHGLAPGAAAGAGGGRLHLLARSQPAGRRLHRRAGDRRGAGAAVHRAGSGKGRGGHSGAWRRPLRPLDRQWPADRRAYRHRRLRLRSPVHDERPRPPDRAHPG